MKKITFLAMLTLIACINGFSQLVELQTWYHDGRTDNGCTTQPRVFNSWKQDGAIFQRVEGKIFSIQKPGTIALKRFWKGNKYDNGMTAVDYNSYLNAGYEDQGIEGYIFATQQPNTIPLKSYFSSTRGDNLTTSIEVGDPSYILVRVEGYIYPPSNVESGINSNNQTNVNTTQNWNVGGVTGKSNFNFAGDKSNTSKTSLVGSPTNSTINGWDCQTQNVNVDINSSSFSNPGATAFNSNIYPGAVYTFQSFSSGALNPIDNDRNPIDISISTPQIKGESGLKVANPTRSNVRTAISNIWNRLKNDNVTSSSFAYKYQEVFNQADMSLRINGGAYGWGFSGNFGFGEKSNHSDRYILIDGTKEFFSIDVDHPKNGLFTTQQNHNDPNQVYISSCVYGIRALAMLTVSIDNQTTNLSTNLKYASLSFGANFDMTTIWGNNSLKKTLNIYIIGGATKYVGPVNDEAGMYKMIDEVLRLSSNINAVPIGYSLRSLNGDILSVNSSVDNFPVQRCIPNQSNLLWDVNLSIKDMESKCCAIYGLTAVSLFSNGSVPIVDEFSRDYIPTLFDRQKTLMGNPSDKKYYKNCLFKISYGEMNDNRTFLRLYYRIASGHSGDDRHIGLIGQKNTGNLQTLIKQKQFPSVNSKFLTDYVKYGGMPNGAYSRDIYDYIDIPVGEALRKMDNNHNYDFDHVCFFDGQGVTFHFRINFSLK